MQSEGSKFLNLTFRGASPAEQFKSNRAWAEYGLRLFTLLWLLTLLTLTLLAPVLVAVMALTLMARSETGPTIMMWMIVALLVRNVGHVSRLLMNSLKSLFPAQGA